ncbi:hypothetical protein [Erythrobacter sp. BLCC-B19]|uniref:hypothetical protein n=1 Tax=Erythrobacter sp. BLCC-B19 TaxID=3025315 RepID=UPI0023601690|nr:hypothetical protein [Erythrobacter sp. BLCC-B19]WDA41771.1 hypothetical protein PS060_02905 [Erythrobacter sp. BLCC-B19]
MDQEDIAGGSSQIVDVSFSKFPESIDRSSEAFVAVITGDGGKAYAGLGGIACAGIVGEAHVQKAGIAMCGPGLDNKKGLANGGAGCVVFAQAGSNAVGGDESVAICARGGDATCGTYGIAATMDGKAMSARPAAVAIARRRNAKGAEARVATGGVAIARDYLPDLIKSGPARAHAGTCGVAIAFEDNHLSGDLGALLVGTYRGKDGSTRFATAVVDGKAIRPGVVYEVDRSGQFVTVG